MVFAFKWPIYILRTLFLLSLSLKTFLGSECFKYFVLVLSFFSFLFFFVLFFNLDGLDCDPDHLVLLILTIFALSYCITSDQLLQIWTQLWFITHPNCFTLNGCKLWMYKLKVNLCTAFFAYVMAAAAKVGGANRKCKA